jgi:hypothetical protein
MVTDCAHAELLASKSAKAERVAHEWSGDEQVCLRYLVFMVRGFGDAGWYRCNLIRVAACELLVRNAFVEPNVIGASGDAQIILSYKFNREAGASFVLPLVDFGMAIGKRKICSPAIVVAGG